MFVGVTRQQGNMPLAHITVAYSGLGRKLRSGKVFFFCFRRRHFLKLSLCKGVLLFSMLCIILVILIYYSWYGWVFFFRVFFFPSYFRVFFFSPHTVGEGFFFSKNFHLVEVKWCIPKGWLVGSYLKGLDQWFSTGGAWPHYIGLQNPT